MNRLDPLYASRLSQDIYDINSELRRGDFIRTYKEDFDAGEDSQLSGETGGLVFLKNPQTIGIAAIGKCEYAGQAFIALKGTASLYDGITDLNAGLKRFHTGGVVHQGFYYAFATFLPQLEQFLQKLPANIHTIHCVGHSLGGALATLSADWLYSCTSKTIKLYTFGSPRVGLNNFSGACRRRLTEDNIFRVYHVHDPVPMVPTWPFIHVPDGGKGDIQLPSPNSLNPILHHSSDTYRKSVSQGGEGVTTLPWDVLRSRRPKGRMEQKIEEWLTSDRNIVLDLYNGRIAGEAVLWVLKKTGHLAAVTAIMAGSTTFTLLDRLAIALEHAAKISKDISFWVLRLIRRLAQLVGVAVAKAVNLTVDLIRSIFFRVHSAISELVMRAGRMIN